MRDSLVLCLSMAREVDAFLARPRLLCHLNFLFSILERYMDHIQHTNQFLLIAVH